MEQRVHLQFNTNKGKFQNMHKKTLNTAISLTIIDLSKQHPSIFQQHACLTYYQT